MNSKKCAILALLIPFTLHAQSFDYLFEHAMAVHKQDRECALTLLNQALALNPQSVETHYNIAYLLKNAGRMHEALAHYAYVLEKEPYHTGAHIGKAQACLMLGDYAQGWNELEWRLGGPYAYTQELATYMAHHRPLQGKKIVLRAEWGAGDTIMFIRYAQLLHEQGAHVIVHLLHESLVPLFKQQPYLDEVVGPQQPMPPFHFQVPMVSLPIVFQTTVATVPNRMPYIHIDPLLVDRWKDYFAHDTTFKIGVCWHGNIIHGREKFIPLAYFAQLADIPNVTLYSLQQHHGLDQMNQLENPAAIKLFDEPIDQIPFLDTAAIMKNLDLVITVDTSIAHLAGSLNVPVWVILPTHADWRWMENRTDSPWYPTMRLFRQQNSSEWIHLLEEVCAALRTLSITFA